MRPECKGWAFLAALLLAAACHAASIADHQAIVQPAEAQQAAGAQAAAATAAAAAAAGGVEGPQLADAMGLGVAAALDEQLAQGLEGEAGAGARRRPVDTEERLRRMRENPELPLVWLDVAINGSLLGRIEAVLFARRAPRTSENFRLLCTGELGSDAAGRRYHLKGSYFYRIIAGFIDQTGADADGIFGGTFHDDPGGITLKHAHPGLLSMAHMGPNTNGGHFSIMMGPAPHLDGQHGVFGQIVSGFQFAEQINALGAGRPNNELLDSKAAQIVDAGQSRPGLAVAAAEYRAVIEAEKRRVAWRSTQSQAELDRLRALWADTELPMVYLDVAIKGVFAGRLEVVLLAKQAPLAAESFRLLASGEAGEVPAGHDGAGKQYHWKGSTFYRIIKGFIDQIGSWTDSPLGGLFLDDPGGLKLNHTRMGLLSMANTGPNTNGGHFSLMMGPQPHLDGKHPVFGEVVDGHNVLLEINALSEGQPNNELKDSKDAMITDSGELRRGTYWDTPEFQTLIDEERKRIAAATTRPK